MCQTECETRGTNRRTKHSVFPPGSDWGQDRQGLRWRQACLVSAEWDLGALGAEGGTRPRAGSWKDHALPAGLPCGGNVAGGEWERMCAGGYSPELGRR